MNSLSHKASRSCSALAWLFVVCSGLVVAETPPLLSAGARLAIIGDSITEQKLYSKFIETYLLACAGRKDIECFQFGWSGEMAVGFSARLDTDLSVFQPTVATLCYGMNDGKYQPYNAVIGKDYETAMRKVLDKLRTVGVRQVFVGSPGVVDTFRFQRFPPADYNFNLAQLGGIARKLAAEHKQTFANVHDTMLSAMKQAKTALGNEYEVAGYDGIHPGPNGHLLMTQAFLKSMGMDGNIGVIHVDLHGAATATAGHTVLSAIKGNVELESTRWPFCFDFDSESPASTRSILPYCTFNADLNRLMLKVTNLSSAKARVTWGVETRAFTREQLQQGVNLAVEFDETPFHASFMDLMEEVAGKQRFETHTIWNVVYPFRSQNPDLTKPEAQTALGLLRKQVSAEHAQFIEAVRQHLKPVQHTLFIEPAP
jgi:lysophospholipase L1-like esterase